MSVFDGLLVLGEDFNRSDVVYDIVADYDWMTLEGCSFILVREYGSNNSFVLRGLYHKAFGELIMVIQDFTVESGQDFESASKVLQVDGEATPVNYNNVREAVKGFVNDVRSVNDILILSSEDYSSCFSPFVVMSRRP